MDTRSSLMSAGGVSGYPDAAAIEAAAAQLQAGRLVAFPTETVYGLGADAENPQAVAAIYAAKGRPSNHPVIAHLAPGADLDYWAAHVPSQARSLITAFWPGPLTLILKRATHIDPAISGGQDSIGLRCPAHPVAQALIAAFAAQRTGGQGGVAAPSANRFGHVSPTLARHVQEEFAPEVANGQIQVLDGGPTEVGIESTILDLSRVHLGGRPVLLRPGGISAGQLEQVLGEAVLPPDADAPRASGTLKAHYAPGTPFRLLPLDAILHLLTHQAGGRCVVASHSCPVAPVLPSGGAVFWQAMPTDADAYAHVLYARMREWDALGVDVILLETPPEEARWAGVRDRVQRAAAAFPSDRRE